MDDAYNLSGLESKVDWEGGVLGAVEYGIRPGQVPEGELRDLWSTACALHAELSPVLERIGEILEAGRLQPGSIDR